MNFPDLKMSPAGYPQIAGTSLVNVSSASGEELASAGFLPMNFRTIFDINARWWIREKL